MPRTTPGDDQFVGSFSGAHAFLSNFHLTDLSIDAVTYRSVEHAFNAAKTLDPVQAAHVRAAPTPRDAKLRGSAVSLRPEWDARVRYDVMRAALAAKFSDPRLAAALAGTGHALLVEGTTWHDQHWGDCRCHTHFSDPGQNHLGRALMALRGAQRGDAPQTWARAAVTGHRPDAFTAQDTTWARGELTRISGKLTADHGTQVAISGAAQGADTWWAAAAANVGLPVWAYVPFAEQAAGWSPAAAHAWTELVERATRTLVLAQRYDPALFHHRNHYLVRDADVVVAVHDPARTTGGTAATIARAQRSGKPIVMVDVPGRRTWLHRSTRG